MGFIELFFKNKKEVTDTDIEQFISQKIEESSTLDYKEIKAYQNVEKLSIHISSFANSEGGLLILGISQDEIKIDTKKKMKIYPKEITWGNPSLDKESLENKLLTLIKPPINGLVIKPVRNKKNEVIFLIDIPKSTNAPHMAFDYRYHKRVNFRKRFMEHFEIINLIKNNWTMKEKLIERIYEPLSSALEKQSRELETFIVPSSDVIIDILADTYYKMQMPFELHEPLDYYIILLDDLIKKEYFAIRVMTNILTKTIMKYLDKPFVETNDWLRVEFKAISDTDGKLFLQHQDIFFLLLENSKIDNFLKKTHWRNKYERISITYSGETVELSLTEFNERIWDKCLAELSNYAKVMQFRESTKSLSEEAWNIMEMIIRI